MEWADDESEQPQHTSQNPPPHPFHRHPEIRRNEKYHLKKNGIIWFGNGSCGPILLSPHIKVTRM
jgi:hypothetical protein